MVHARESPRTLLLLDGAIVMPLLAETTTNISESIGLALHPVDIALVVVYLVLVAALGLWLSRGVKTGKDLFLGGKRDEAIAAVPDDFVDEISLVGPPERIRNRLQAWEASDVTTLMVGATDKDGLRQAAELILG